MVPDSFFWTGLQQSCSSSFLFVRQWCQGKGEVCCVSPASKANTGRCLIVLFSNVSPDSVTYECCNYWCLFLYYFMELLLVSSPWSFLILVNVWWFVALGSSSINSSGALLSSAKHMVFHKVLFFYITVPYITKSKSSQVLYLLSLLKEWSRVCFRSLSFAANMTF